MKFLKGQVEKVKDKELTVMVKVIDTATQARLGDLSLESSVEGRVKMIGYMLNNCIESVDIDGVDYDPAKLANSADISDPDTLAMMLRIGVAVIGVAFTSEDDEKK